MTIQWITMRGYIGGSDNMACYKALLRTDRKRDSNTASDYYCFLCFISIRWGLSTSLRVAGAFSITQGTLGNSEGSHGNCTGAIEQRCLIAYSQDTSSEVTVQQAEKEVPLKNCPTASPSSQGKLLNY